MKRFKKFLLPAIISAGSCIISAPTYANSRIDLPATSKTGLWPSMPSHLKKNQKGDKFFWNNLVILGEPKVTMLDDWKAELSFTTEIPTPPVTVYFGTYEKTVDQAWPRFHAGVKESKGSIELSHTLSTKHRVELNLGKLLGHGDINGMKKQGGGVIYYRIEVMSHGSDVETPGIRFFDWRFGFRDGQLVPTVTEGPFIHQLTANSAIISWNSSLAANGTVIVSEKKFKAKKKAKHFEVKLTGLAAGKTHNYSIQLTDATNTIDSRQFYFRTPPRNVKKYTFVVLGDSRGDNGGGEYNYNGVNARIMGTLARAAFAKGAEFIVHTGDMINGYTTSPLDFSMQLQAHKDAIEPIAHYIPFYTMMGNHEIVLDIYLDPESKKGGYDFHGLPIILMDKQDNQNSEILFANEFVHPQNGPTPDRIAAKAPKGKTPPPYKENVYFFDYGTSRFIVMNNNYWVNSAADVYGGNLEGYILDDQKDWLLDMFKKTKRDNAIKHLFIFAQEPMFPNGKHTKDAMWYSGGHPDKNNGFDRRYVAKRRDEIWQAFVATGKAVSGNFGDEHHYTRTLITEDRNGKKFQSPAWQLVSGGAGAPYAAGELSDTPWRKNVKKYDNQFHYTLFNVDGNNVTLEVYNINNILIERVKLTGQKNKKRAN
jgi:hypothetical protein